MKHRSTLMRLSAGTQANVKAVDTFENEGIHGSEVSDYYSQATPSRSRSRLVL